MTEVVRLAIADEVATITLARPDKLTGEGKAFCAGGDIAAWGGLSPLDMGQDWVRNGHRVFDRLARLKVPMIAALNGHALGGGLELAATADIRICEAQAKLGLPETGIGMIPGWSGTQRLVTRFGARAVRRLALAGEIVTAEVALAMGLVDEVVEKGGAMDRAMALAAQVRSRGPVANTIAKQLINAAEGEDAAATMEILAGALVSYTDDLREGVAGFREKRPPVFQGR
jgi:enoyl-CoA hydratase